MSFALALVTGPAVEPVTLEETRKHMRVDHEVDDDVILPLIVAARRKVETDTRRALITQTWDLALPRFPACGEIEIPLAPLQSVTSITYTDATGNATTWAASNYLVDTFRLVPRIVPAYGVAWPMFTPRPLNAVVVRFVAGYGTGEDLPAELRLAVLTLVGHWYDNREAVGVARGGVYAELPLAYSSLVGPYRIERF